MNQDLVLTGPFFQQKPASQLLVLAAGANVPVPLGQLVAPAFGQTFFVNENAGSDTNPGTTWNSPLATIQEAHDRCTAEQNDVVYVSRTAHQTEAVLWTKNQTHLIGVGAPLQRGKRARISSSGSTPFSYLFDVSASGCLFQNLGTFYGFPTTGATTPICWNDTGGRNCYDGVEILGFGDDTVSTGTANQTGARAFKLSGSTGETTFRNCVFGVDTKTRGATNYNVEISGGAPRITFEGCDFEAYIGSGGASGSFLLVGAAGIDRYVKFQGCRFMNATGSAATAMTQAMNISGSAGGMIELDEATSGWGFTKWETSASGRLLTAHATIATSLPGLAVAPVP